MLKGYALQAYVCLDCGTIGSCLNNSDVQDLQKLIEKKKTSSFDSLNSTPFAVSFLFKMSSRNLLNALDKSFE